MPNARNARFLPDLMKLPCDLPTCVAAMAAFMALSACAHAAQPAVATTVASSSAPAMLPDRLLTCTLGHATNVDATRDQRDDEIVYDSYHQFSVFLPAIPVRTSPPPDATEPAEPVKKGTGIVSDPDGIATNLAGPVSRVVDLWPDRVELIMPMKTRQSKLLIINGINMAAGKARLFMTDAKDLATFDMERIYSGDCNVSIKPVSKRS